MAYQCRNYDVIHELLRYGADVNICSVDGNSALHHLIEGIKDDKKFQQKLFLQTTKMFLQHGMEHKPNTHGLTPLLVACLMEREAVVEFLLSNLSVDDWEKATCFELLASSILLYKGGLQIEVCRPRRSE